MAGRGGKADKWLSDYETAKSLADETAAIIQDRKTKGDGLKTQVAAKLTTAARRKLTALGVAVKKLKDDLQTSPLTDSEKSRRLNNLHQLAARRENLLEALRTSSKRNELMAGAGDANYEPRETEETAGRSNQQVLQLQAAVMANQDRELEDMEAGVESVRHIAGAIGEEATLHTRLLGEMEQDMDTTSARLRSAGRQLKTVMRRQGMCKQCVMIILLAAGFGAALGLFFGVWHAFG